jgi:hypothetical protein
MSERPEPDLDHVREAMREHDERQGTEETPAPGPDEEDGDDEE